MALCDRIEYQFTILLIAILSNVLTFIPRHRFEILIRERKSGVVEKIGEQAT